MDGPISIFPRDLLDLLKGASAPLIFDVRRAAAFDADSRMLVSAQRGAPDHVAEWGRQIPAGQPVVVYCVYGHEVSQGVATALRESGIDARYLAGGITGWAELGLPLREKTKSECLPMGGDRVP
jgi:rhodanese-related sulfurtransferase